MVQYCYVPIIFILTLIVYLTNGFNLSPKPNLSLNEPRLKFRNKTRSSYFGFTINLRNSSVIVGAPRAQSTNRYQLKINETGAIYKCSIESGQCKPFIFDSQGNEADSQNGILFDSKKKDQQWLGASMDGGSNDNDKLVVCAPRIIAVNDIDLHYYMHGICYLTADTLGYKATNLKQIAALRLKSMEVVYDKNGAKHSYYMYGEQGVSVHMTKNNEEIIIGAPGIYKSKGSIIRFHSNFTDVNTTIRDKLGDEEETNNITEVPNPELWGQDDDSYFGYSVGSGYFNGDLPKKIYYVASTPHGNHQSGEVHIFDIVKNPGAKYHSIQKYYTFHGSQFGEYFGFAVLAEDLNSDGWADLIIAAPQYNSDGHVEQGAIYVFINKGSFEFVLQKIIKSPVEGTGRFGSTISSLGDINHDGFNDIAVGAPFAGNGTVFIYLGSSKGLREVSSQQLNAVPTKTSSGSQSAMFGYGLSKGSDIDSNGFNDLAIGAPNAESVFVYRAYPVFKIHATINSRSSEIHTNQTKFQIKICYSISTTSQKSQSQDIAFRGDVDRRFNRVKLVPTNSSEFAFTATAETKTKCQELDANVEFSSPDVYKPIELELHYALKNGIPNSEEFCEKCAAVDPADPKVAFAKISFTTGCKAECIADLKVTTSEVSSPYILGSNIPFLVKYEVTNFGETAYMPQIEIKSSKKIPFKKMPPSCNQKFDSLLCDLNRGLPMFQNNTDTITIVYDFSLIQGSLINFTASVFCTGKERNPSDNIITNDIALREFTNIEVNGQRNTTYIDLGKVFNSTEIINEYETRSNGPSEIQELEIAFEIPIAYIFYGSAQPVPVIDINNISIQGAYNNQLLLVNETKLSYTRNSVKFENDAPRARGRPNSNTEQEKVNNELLSKEFREAVPIKRRIVFSCVDPETSTCVRAVMKVKNFVHNTTVNITLKYHVDLNEINKILKEPLEVFVIIPNLVIVKTGDLIGNTINVSKNFKYSYNIIFKHHLYDSVDTPLLLIIIIAILVGILVLSTIAYIMYKAGFFKREIKEKIASAKLIPNGCSEAEDADI